MSRPAWSSSPAGCRTSATCRLRSGRRVAEALDVGRGRELRARRRRGADGLAAQQNVPTASFPLLHGEAGEDGALQEVLDLAGVPYVGAAPAAARVAFDKPIAKQVVDGAGLRTPASAALPADTIRSG